MCGPYSIGPTERTLYHEVCELLVDFLPFKDPNKISDEDLAYRFLIAADWDAKAAAQMLRNYLQWRSEENMDGVLDESFPDEVVQGYLCSVEGVDREGRPVYWTKPNQSLLAKHMPTFGTPASLRWAFYAAERARAAAKLAGKDRFIIVVDANDIGLRLLTTSACVYFIKDFAAATSSYYPELMMNLFVINTSTFFATVWNWARVLLPERVQLDVHVLGEDFQAGLQEYIDADQIPQEFWGRGSPWKPFSGNPEGQHSSLAASKDAVGTTTSTDWWTMCYAWATGRPVASTISPQSAAATTTSLRDREASVAHTRATTKDPEVRLSSLNAVSLRPNSARSARDKCSIADDTGNQRQKATECGVDFFSIFACNIQDD